MFGLKIQTRMKEKSWCGDKIIYEFKKTRVRMKLRREGRSMRRSIFYLLFFTVVLSLIFGGITFADQFAFTEDGRKVLLRDDGTWEYVKEQYDFRKVRWGMTKAQVKEIENSKLVDEKDATLTYRTSVDNMACLAIYSFVRRYAD